MSEGSGAGAGPQQERLALDLALRWLGARARTERELRERLHRRGVPPDVVEATVERLRNWGYLDDRAFAVDYVEQALAVRQIGPRRIVEELRRRGISGRLAAEILEERLTPQRELELARAAARRRLARWQDGDPAAARRRLYRYLVGRGFDSELAAEVVRAELGDSGAGAS